MSLNGGRTSGISLLEVLVVMVIMSMSTLGLLALHQQMARAAHLTEQSLKAEQLATQQLVQWQKKSLTADSGVPWQDGAKQTGEYDVQWWVTQPINPDSYLIKLEVSWESAEQDKRYSLHFMTIYTHVGLSMITAPEVLTD